MVKRRPGLLTSLLLIALPCAALGQSLEIRVIEGEVMWPVESASRPHREDWWLVSPRGGDDGTARVTVTFHQPYCDKPTEPCDSHAWSQKVEVRAAGDGGKAFRGPFYLLRGAGLDWRKVRRARLAGEFDPMAARSEIAVSLGGRDYVIARVLAGDKSRITVSLRAGAIEQEIYACPTGGPSYPFCGDEGFEEIRWAGDLDGDGKLDLLAQFTDKYSKRSFYLHTSGRAGPGRLVALSAEYSYFGD